jgi:hypothetical protein
MNPTFSPFKCIPWWIYPICVAVLVGTFILGRWLGARPVVYVEAWSHGKKVTAEVLQGGNKLGETPAEGDTKTCEVRPKGGKSLELTLKYDRFEKTESRPLKRGRQLFRVEFPTITVEFHAYDTLGRELRDDLGIDAQVRTDTTDWQRMPAPLTELEGTKKTVEFRSGNARYKGQGTLQVDVEWLDKEGNVAWLKTGLPQKLRETDPNYAETKWQGIIDRRLAPQTKEADHDYPCLFMAPENIGKVVPRPPKPPPKPPPTGPDDAIPYETIRAQKLTDQDVANKTRDGLRATINLIYAHNGFKFTDQKLLAYYKQSDWYKPTTQSQEEARKRISNENERANLEFLTQKRNSLPE